MYTVVVNYQLELLCVCVCVCVWDDVVSSTGKCCL